MTSLFLRRYGDAAFALCVTLAALSPVASHAAPIVVTPGSSAGYLYVPAVVGATGGSSDKGGVGGGGSEEEDDKGGGGVFTPPPVGSTRCTTRVTTGYAHIPVTENTRVEYSLIGGAGGASMYNTTTLEWSGGGGGGSSAVLLNNELADDVDSGAPAVAEGGNSGQNGKTAIGAIYAVVGDTLTFYVGGGGALGTSGFVGGGGSGYMGGGGGTMSYYDSSRPSPGGSGGGIDGGAGGMGDSENGYPGRFEEGGDAVSYGVRRTGSGGYKGTGGSTIRGTTKQLGGGGFGGGGACYSHTQYNGNGGSNGGSSEGTYCPEILGSLNNAQGLFVSGKSGQAGRVTLTYYADSCWMPIM